MEGATVVGPGENVPEEPGLGADLGSLPAQEWRFQTVLSVCNKGPSTPSSPRWPSSQEDAKCLQPSYSLRFPAPSVCFPFPLTRGCSAGGWA